MENKVLFLDPLDIRPHFKRGTEGLIGASILGGTGLMSGILGSSSAHANNKAMIEYNQWAQKDAQAYNTQMYERQLADQESMYNKYQSPQAIAQQLKAAGINPSALAAGQGFSGGSMPSVPAAGSSSVTSLSGLQNTGTPIGQGLQAAAGAIADLSHANEADVNAKATSEKLSHEVNLLLARRRAEEAVAINTELQNSLTQKYGDQKWSGEIGHLASMAYANWAQGDLNSAEANYKDVLRQLANFQLDMDNETRTYLIGKVVESYNLLKAQVESEKTVPGLNRSASYRNRKEGDFAGENALTVKEIRPAVKKYNEALASYMDTKDFVAANTAWNEVQQSLYDLMAAKLVPEEIVQHIEKLKKANRWYEVNQILGIVDEGVKAYGTYYGAKTGKGFVDAKDTENRIRQDYNNFLREEKQERYENKRHAVAGSGHYWGQEY